MESPVKSITNQSLLSCLCEPIEQPLTVTNPATGEVLGYIATQTETEIEQAITRAQQAQQTWKKTTAKARATILKRWFDLIMQNQQDLARIMTLEQGKPLVESRNEVAYGASFIEWFAEEGKRTCGATIPEHTNDRRLMTIKQPIGVAAAITPWNFPIAMLTRKAAPALAAGCTFIGKPANQTPISAYAVAELGYQAGLPRDVLQLVLHHTPEVVGKIFCDSEVIKKLSFTGSTRVGRLLTAQCANTLKRVSMELGGNAPFIIFADADLDSAVTHAVACKFRNAGQTCVCANRFYVHNTIYDQFIKKFVAAIKQLKIGNGLNDDVNIGPMIDLAAKNKINDLVNRSIQQGATLVTGGQSQKGLFIEPVLLGDIDQSMDIVKEEIFGPVATVLSFGNDEELVEKANDTIYGLAAYFFSRDINRVWKIAEALEYGMVGINEGIISTELAPFGGIKQSGFGREGAKEGIDEYLQTKYVCFGGIQ